MSNSRCALSLIMTMAFVAAAHLPAQEPLQHVISGVAKSLARPDLVLHYVDYGQGEPVLVLMGGPGVPGKGMEPVARIIAKRARAIVPDQRGSGASMPKETEAHLGRRSERPSATTWPPA